MQIAVHYPQRRMLVLYAAMFVSGSVLCATALIPGLFIAGHVIQGLFTSMMLIVLAGAGCSAAFFGASEPETHRSST